MADVRAVRRLIEELRLKVDTLPISGVDTSSFASKDAVVELATVVGELTQKVDVLKKSLDDSLEKLGIFEKKLLDIESRKTVDDVLGVVDTIDRKVTEIGQRDTTDILSAKLETLEVRLKELESRPTVAPTPAPAPVSEIVYATTDDETGEEA